MSSPVYFLAHALQHFNLPPLSPHGLPEIVGPGSEFRINAARIESVRDSTGFSWLELLDDVPEQVRLFGVVRARRGPASAELRKPQPGFEADELREAARQEAHKIEDEQERLRALRQVEHEYGPRPTSHTTATFRR